MAQCYSSSVNIGPLTIQSQLFLDREKLGCKGFIHMLEEHSRKFGTFFLQCACGYTCTHVHWFQKIGICVSPSVIVVNSGLKGGLGMRLHQSLQHLDSYVGQSFNFVCPFVSWLLFHEITVHVCVHRRAFLCMWMHDIRKTVFRSKETSS